MKDLETVQDCYELAHELWMDMRDGRGDLLDDMARLSQALLELSGGPS